MDRCYICGCELQKTNYDRKICPNHGIIDSDEIAEKEDKEIRERSYLG
jgi:hypothetical protein